MKNFLRLILCLLGLCCMTQQSPATDPEILSSQLRALTGQDPSNYQPQAPQDVKGRALGPQKATRLEQVSLTVEYAAKLFFLSFRFSQGSLTAQKYIFYYLHMLHLDWNITDVFKEQLSIKSEQHIRRWLAQPGLPHTKSFLQPRIPDQVKATIEDELWDFQHVFREEDHNRDRKVAPDRESVIESLAKELVLRDYTYLAVNKGRPRPPNQGKVTPLTDPFLSHVCHYGFLGNSTGSEEYDRMFRDVTAYLKKSVDPTLMTLMKVIRVHNELHPETPVSLPLPEKAGARVP